MGTSWLEDDPAIALIVEGGPDWLAAIHFAVVNKRKGLRSSGGSLVCNSISCPSVARTKRNAG